MLGTSCSVWTCWVWIPGSPSCHATSKSDAGFEDRSHAITAFDDADDFTPSCRFAQNQQLGREKKHEDFWRWRWIINWKWITAWWFRLVFFNWFIYLFVCLFVCFCKDWTFTYLFFYFFIYLFIHLYNILFWPLNMDAMITEFECNSFRSVKTAKQSIIRRPIVQSKMLNHMLYSLHMKCRVSSTCSQICRFPISMCMVWGWQGRFCKQTHAITAI